MRTLFMFCLVISFLISSLNFASAMCTEGRAHMHSDKDLLAEDFGDEFTDITGEDIGGGFGDEEFIDLDTLIDDLDSLKEDLLSELEDAPSKPLRVTITKIKKVIRLLEDASESSEDDPEDCGDSLEDAVSLFEKVADQFESRQCKSSRASKRCISQDIVEIYLEDFEDLLDELDDAVSVDDDEDDVPDVCGFSG